jgi:solute carrier family 25 (mitochondrial dicarboxylate transporter), member 10
VRLQTRRPDAPKTTISTFTHILKSEGFFGLYAGLSAALLRQLTYSTVRFGVYEDFKVRFAPKPNPSNPDKPAQQSMLNLILMSSVSGALGGVAGNPGDILNVRMQSDASLPPEKQRNYKHAIDGLIRMTREEGVASLFRGVGPNAARALLMTSSQLASYDGFKRICLDSFGMKDNIATHFVSSLAAGFVATSICNPVDVIKTRIMNAGKKESLMNILGKAQQKEGLFWMYRGWTPSFMRLGPQTVITMIFLEQHKKLYRSIKGYDD